MTANYIYKELTSEVELEQAFRLRYKTFNEMDLKIFVKPNESNIDISHYDLHSKHVGLFFNDELIATHRLCVEKHLLFNQKVFDVGRKYSLFNDIYFEDSQTSSELPEFPFISYPTIPEEVRKFYNELKTSDTLITEAGKFAIKKEHRGIRIMKHMFDCMIVVGMMWFGNKKGVAVTTTDANHPGIFKASGFEEVAQFKIGGLAGLTLLLTLSCNLDQSGIPEELHPHFYSHKKELQETGKIEYHS